MSYTKLKKSRLIKHKIRAKISKLTTDEYLRVLVLRTLGNFLILTSLFFIAKTFYLPVREEIRYFIDSRINKKYVIVENQEAKISFDKSRIPGKVAGKDQKLINQPKGLLAKALNIQEIELLVPQDPDFSIVVPKIGANSRILPNIDASDEKVYLDALNKGVAHASGSKFPGESGHIFLFAHSTDYFWNIGSYNAIFYLLSKLVKCDEINLFYQGQRFVYKVVGATIVDPSQVEYITRQSSKEFLTLQTCWPPGTTLKRLLVFAARVSN